jgi:hypothetical protein
MIEQFKKIFFEVCPKTKKIIGFTKPNKLKWLYFPFFGLLALTWFLLRVIPKPSRATYPCMKVAAPMASTFIVYLVGLFTSMYVFQKARKNFASSKYIFFILFIIFCILVYSFTFFPNETNSYANVIFSEDPLGPNNPIGQAKGISPGRVVWVFNPDATDETCTNSLGDYWWQEDNTNQTIVNEMVSQALQMLTNKASDSTAWEALFRYFNNIHGKGDIGYAAGEKIVIKLNLNTNGCSSSSDNYERKNLKSTDTSPQIVYAILDQLVNKVGVAQADISIGDPGRNVDHLFWNKCYNIFPEVKYWGKGNNRTPIVRSINHEIRTSNGELEDWLPNCYMEAAYMINIPVLKKHHRAGISLAAKNHFGTFVPFNGDAFHWHNSLPCTQGKGTVDNGGYGKYRCFVDIMGHQHLGGKTILYLIDGIWSATNYGDPPIKWRMAPFNNDWPSSIFLSQDPVAIESVGFDFMYEEFDTNHPTQGNKAFPRYSGVDDFLHQAADSLNWPESLIYDPEGDGIALRRSLGTHEHWNNALYKEYSRNLGTGEGIELVKIFHNPTTISQTENYPDEFSLYNNYPNPFNPVTSISYTLKEKARVKLEVIDITGRVISELVHENQAPGYYKIDFNANNNASGILFYRLTSGSKYVTKRMLLVK